MQQLFHITSKLLIFLLLFSGTENVCAQSLKKFTYHFSDVATAEEVIKIAAHQFASKKYTTATASHKDVNSFLDELRNNGYLSASCDSVQEDSLNIEATFYCGEKVQWGFVSKGNVDGSFLSGTGFRSKSFSEKPIESARLNSVINQILKNCENNGYPFASIKLDSVSITENKCNAVLNLNKNKLTYIDSVILKGNAQIAPVYVYNYIGIKPGYVYNESLLRRIGSRMKELPFLAELKPSQLVFGDKNTKLYLFLDNKKASQFDGVIGLAPDENKAGKVNLTGEAHLKLQNSLRHGEIIEFNWKQLAAQSQDLKIRFLYPFILSTHFGFDGGLAIFKKDSTYIDVTKNVGVQYSLTGNNFIKAFYINKQSDLQDTRGLEFATTLPDYADVTINSYGTTFHYEKLDYRLNPRKGFTLELTGSAGNKEIRKNSALNDELYDSLKLQSATYTGEIHFDYYWSPGGRHVLNIGTISGFIHNENLFSNELFRIGGLRSLRGFDEESIYASQFSIGKFEYRYLLEQNSFLFAFFNIAGYKNESRNVNLNDTPFGFGAGINFETKLGIMSVSYALGKQFDNPVYFKNGKIHFGIVNYF